MILWYQSINLPLESRIRAYFTHSGYQQIESKPTLKFKRGKKRASWFTFNPSKVETVATITINQQPDRLEVTAILEANTTGQIVTNDEKNFYESELINLESVLVGKQELNSLPSQLDTGKRICDYQIKALFIGAAKTIIFIAVFFAIGIILGVFVVHKFIPNPDVAYITTIVTSLVLTTVFFKVWDKWRKRKA